MAVTITTYQGLAYTQFLHLILLAIMTDVARLLYIVGMYNMTYMRLNI